MSLLLSDPLQVLLHEHNLSGVIGDVLGVRLRGFLGWWVTRSYHLYQLPLFSRKLRVVTDWTVSLLFKRDIAELSVLAHPHRLGE